MSIIRCKARGVPDAELTRSEISLPGTIHWRILLEGAILRILCGQWRWEETLPLSCCWIVEAQSVQMPSFSFPPEPKDHEGALRSGKTVEIPLPDGSKIVAQARKNGDGEHAFDIQLSLIAATA